MQLANDLPTTLDVAVIGGGLLGASTCYWLAHSGVNVALLERDAPAYGATGRNGGFVTEGTAESYSAAIKRSGHDVARAIYKLTLENRTLLRQVLAEEEIECDYRETGSLHLALNEEQFAELYNVASTLQNDDIEAVLLNRQQVQDKIQTALGEEIMGGLFQPEAGLVHSARLVQGILRAAMRHGAKSYEAEVTELQPVGDAVQIRTRQGDTLQSKRVIVAVNAWTSQLIPELANYITPIRGQMLSYAPIKPVFSMGLGASLTPTGEYWQQTLSGSIVIGGCRDAAPGRDIGMHESVPTAEVQTALEQVIPHLFPELTGLTIEKRWAGLMGFTADYLPITDVVPHMADRAWFVGGFCGHGMPFGMRLGQLLAEAVTNTTVPCALHPLRLRRAQAS